MLTSSPMTPYHRMAQIVHTIRWGWQFIERINYDMLFLWFIGFSINDGP